MGLKYDAVSNLRFVRPILLEPAGRIHFAKPSNFMTRIAASVSVFVFSLLGSAVAGIVQEAYLKASNTDFDQIFGNSVAVWGDTLVVGAPGEGSGATGVNGNPGGSVALNSGAVYVFARSGTNWSQQAYLKASNSGADDWFGVSVALSEDTLVVGAQQES